jgi:hypothetical protein
MIKGILNGKPFGSEQNILTAILHYLISLGIRPVHHRNTGAIFGKNGDGSLRFGRAKTTLNQRGAPDILMTYRGRGVAIEVKRPDGRLSNDQKEWLSVFQKPPNNGAVIVARSVDDVERAIRELDCGNLSETILT